MNRLTRAHKAGLFALCAGIALPVAAQEAGGVLMTFGVSQNLSFIDNASLAPSSPGTTLRTTTDLSFGIRSQTRTSTLAFNVTGSINGIDRPGGGGFDTEVGEPRFSLRYTQRAADSTLTTRISYSERDITFLDPLTDFRDEDGNIIFSEDFIDLSGSGTRQNLSYGATLSIRDNLPFGLTFSAAVTDLNYVDTTTPELTDSTRTNLGVEARLNINPVTTGTVALNHEELRLEGGTLDTTTLDAGLSIDRPDGAIGFGLTATEVNAGTRLALRFSRSFLLPGDVTMGASLGITRAAASDDLFFTGSFTYARPLPNGQINARLNRSFGTGNDGDEEVQTSLSVGATHALTPLATLGLNAAYARTELTAFDDVTEIASIGATISYDLTPDWDLSAGYTFETRDTTDTDRADRSTLSVTLARDFQFRP